MKRIIDLKPDEARQHFLKGVSYFKLDLPNYINFESIINAVGKVIAEKSYSDFSNNTKPRIYSDVNYQLDSNKDGKFAWRPYELMHPAIYVSLVNLICKADNWSLIVDRFEKFNESKIECCSIPVQSENTQSDPAAQVTNWWHRFEQKSLENSLRFSHVLHTDVADCYGSLYTHSISWALHGRKKAKNSKGNKSLLGNKIDIYLRDSRYGQTNGICQGSVLMDFIAELVLGYVDMKIGNELGESSDFKILRYRDDYRIFTNCDTRANEILKTISDKLRIVGMKLGVAKTHLSTNVVETSVKPDKLAGIALQDLGKVNAKTIQKQLLRLHSFGQRFPNSGALKRLLGDMHQVIFKKLEKPTDLRVQVAIATDIGFGSPSAFPAVAGILSHLISRAKQKREKDELWKLVYSKMKKIPNNGYLEIWLQRVTENETIQLPFKSDENICRIVSGEQNVTLWNNEWIQSKELSDALAVDQIVVESRKKMSEVVSPDEIALFIKSAWYY